MSDAQAFLPELRSGVAEGDFDCERDTDHDDFELCDNCVARVALTEAYLRRLKQGSQIRPPR